MKVKLEAFTQWADKSKLDNPEDIISYCARVSNPSNQTNFATSEKLLRYCVRHKHWSVFEMSNVVMEIEAPRDITRQILRHRSFHFQEFSQRYADPFSLNSSAYYREARLQDETNRQNSLPTADEGVIQEWQALQWSVMDSVSKAYKRAQAMGLAKEVCRVLLPEGLTGSKMYVNGTVRDWFHYCQVRGGHGTQSEHVEIAKQCWVILKEVYPFLGEIEVEIE